MKANFLCKNQRYRELNSKIIKIQDALTANLSPQLQSLVNTYDDVESEHECIVRETMYR
jgi:hypothetical protein